VAREEIRRTVLDRVDKAVAGGDLPAGTNCAALVRYVMAAMYGLSVEAASGAPYVQPTNATDCWSIRRAQMTSKQRRM